MLSHYLGPIGTAANIFPFIAFLILIPMIVIHYWRFGQLRQLRAIVFYSLLFYVVTAYFLVILPLPDRFEGFCTFYGQTKTPRLEFFAFIGDIQALNPGLSGLALLRALPSNPAFLQAFFNALLLLPLGFYLRYFYRYGVVKALLIAFGVTLFFELTQLSGLYGLYPCPYRLFDVDDLILNTGGAMVGYSLAAMMAFLPDLSHKPEGYIPVTSLRRAIALLLDLVLYGLISSLIRSLLFPADHILSSITDWIGLALWFIVMPAVWHGYTPGKRVVFMRVCSMDGSHVTLRQLVIRYGVLIYAYPLLVYLTSQLRLPGFWEFMVFAALTALYFIFVVAISIVRDDDRGLHDWLAGTRQVVSWQSYRQTQPMHLPEEFT